MHRARSSGDVRPRATAAPTLRGDEAGADSEPAYRIVDGTRHVSHGDRSELPGHYEATFETDAGERFDRYVTDKGRAELLRLVDAGQATFTSEEMGWLTTEPTIDALRASMAGEGAEGA